MREALFLEPVDVWSFRDGRPFEAGEAFEARSLFPPYPWTILGCLRTAILRKLCPDPERYAGRGRADPCARCGTGPCSAEPVVGKAGEESPFSTGPPLLARVTSSGEVEEFYPAARDLVREDRENGLPRLLRPVAPADGAIHSLRGLWPVALIGEERVKSWPKQWLERGDLERYLAGHPPESGRASPPKVLQEPRIGVGIHPHTRSARRGQLYMRDVVRIEEDVQHRVGLLVQASQPLGLDGEAARLGGDGRMVTICQVPAPPPVRLPEIARLMKVYLASPTWFAGGWRPAWLDGSTLEGRVPGTDVRVRLVGTALGDPLGVGGWNLKEQRPRALRPLVGAGSVYFLELIDGDWGSLGPMLHGQSLCDDPVMAKAGFGLAFLGRY
jgi:CRISPR-associated protein Cmr3